MKIRQARKIWKGLFANDRNTWKLRHATRYAAIDRYDRWRWRLSINEQWDAPGIDITGGMASEDYVRMLRDEN